MDCPCYSKSWNRASTRLHPLSFFRDRASQQYIITVLLPSPGHLCRAPLFHAIALPPWQDHGASLQRAATRFWQLIPANSPLESSDPHDLLSMPHTINWSGHQSTGGQELRASPPRDQQPHGAGNTEGSARDDGQSSSAWLPVQKTHSGFSDLFGRNWNLSKHAKVEDGEIHGIQHSLRGLRNTGVSNTNIWIGADRQNAQRAIAGRPAADRSHIMEGLEDMKILQQARCRIRGKWTPSHRASLVIDTQTQWQTQATIKQNALELGSPKAGYGPPTPKHDRKMITR